MFPIHRYVWAILTGRGSRGRWLIEDGRNNNMICLLNNLEAIIDERECEYHVRCGRMKYHRVEHFTLALDAISRMQTQ